MVSATFGDEMWNARIYIKDVDSDSDAYAQGVRPGAQLVMVSATFGDEMWNARNVGMTQFQTVVKSRFGSTMKLALEKEDKGFLDGLFGFGAKQETEEDAVKKEQELSSIFEQEEAKLAGKGGNMWDVFR